MATDMAPGPDAPLNVRAARVTDCHARVTWNNDQVNPQRRRQNLVERMTDEGPWTQVASLDAGSTNYFDNGISPNHRYRYRVRAFGSVGSEYCEARECVYTTPAPPRAVRLAHRGGGRVEISVEAASPWAEGFLYGLSVDGGAWGPDAPMGSTAVVEVGGGEVRARARAVLGDLVSDWAESTAVTEEGAPGAPTLGPLKPVYALPSAARVTWTCNHADGSAQIAAQVEVAGPSGGVEVIDVGTEGAVDVELSQEGAHRVRVRTKGVDPSWGPWSPQAEIRAEYAPQAHFTSPAIDGSVVDEAPFEVAWEVSSFSGVSAQEIRLLSASGDVLHSAVLPPDARSYEFSAGTYLPQAMRAYSVELVATDGYSLSARTARRFEVRYAGPAMPHVTVAYDRSDMTARVTALKGEGCWVLDERGFLVSPEYWDGETDRVTVSAGFSDSGVPGMASIGAVMPTARMSVSRLLPDGSQELIAGDMEDGNEVIDRLPPLNVDYSYIVTAYSDIGTATTVEVSARLDSDGFEAFNFGADAAEVIVLGLDADASTGSEHGGEWFQFIGADGLATLPAFYPDGALSVDGTHSYIVTTEGEYRAVDRARRDVGNAVCWFRDHWGGRHRVKADWTLGYSAQGYGVWTVGASLTEAMWEEPRHG